MYKGGRVLANKNKENVDKKEKNNNIITTSIILGIMCFLLTAGINIQINTVTASGCS